MVTGGAGGAGAPLPGPTGQGLTEPLGQPTQDERLFAALAYLSYLVGFWFIGPLAIYGLKGRTSRFVRFHAGQALVATLATVAGVMIAVVLLIGLGFATALLHAATDNDELAVVFPVIRILGSLLFAGVPTVLLLIAAARAYGGTHKPVPIVGRFAKPIQEPLFRIVDSIAGSTSGKSAAGGAPAVPPGTAPGPAPPPPGGPSNTCV